MNTLMLRRRAMMLNAKNSVTNPECVFTPHMVLERGTVHEWEPAGLTEYLEVNPTDTIRYKAPSVPPSDRYPPNSTNMGHLCAYDANKRYCEWWNNWANGNERTLNLSAYGTARNAKYIRLGVYIDGLADSYCYNATTGVIYYAGINTPYYGKTNIND